MGWVTFVYLGASVFYLLKMIRQSLLWGRIAGLTAVSGFVLQSLAMIHRWAESYRLGIGHAPLANFYESLVFFAWAIALLCIVIEWRLKSRNIGVFAFPMAFLLLAYASFSPGVDSRIQPLIPALQSNWLISHVVTCFLGYAAFAVAFGFGILYLMKDKKGKDVPGRFLGSLPDPETLDEWIYQSVFFGFVIFSVGIITGSVWAQYAWGSYWSWDPKETWSLITWLVYAALLHSRFVREWRGRRMAFMAIAGFAAVLFTYLGVNYLAGLHSYIK
ncbi:MAG: c-type cytochrome biogenesis protein CcsB [Syntrophales bacterium]